jgi:hypothetical protein
MDHPPSVAQVRYVRGQRIAYPPQMSLIEPLGLAELRRTMRAVQKERRLALRSEDVDMRGAMVVRIDRHAKAIESQNSRHGSQ